MVRRMRGLQIVPWALWKEVRRRLDECRAAYTRKKDRAEGAPTRADVYPKALVRPICGYCGSRLILGKSGRYASFCCQNGIHRKRDCQLNGFKSVRIVEGAVLAALEARVLVPAFIGRALAEANAHLAEATARPRVATGPMEAEIRSKQSERDRLVKILDAEGEDGLAGVVASLKSKERRLKELSAQLAEVRARDEPPPPAMTLPDVEGMLADLRGLLSGDVAVAAPLVSELTGPVVVEQIPGEGGTIAGEGGTIAGEEDGPGEGGGYPRGKKRPRPIWVAKFTVDAATILVRLTATRGHPTSTTPEYLQSRGWTMSEAVVATIEKVSLPQHCAARVAELVGLGLSLKAISGILGISPQTVTSAWEWARAGDGPPAGAQAWYGEMNRGDRLPLYRQLAAEVARRRDDGWEEFSSIAKDLGVCGTVVQRAYDWAHREELVAAGAEGSHSRRDNHARHAAERNTRRVAEKYREIHRLRETGAHPDDIAVVMGCSVMTVYRALAWIRAARANASPPSDPA
jgi:site-specific DNA recombinase